MLRGLEGDLDAPNCFVDDATVYFDSGAHMPTVTNSLLPAEFIECIKTHNDNVDYRDDAGTTIQIDTCIRFSNADFDISRIAKVIPQSRMPN